MTLAALLGGSMGFVALAPAATDLAVCQQHHAEPANSAHVELGRRRELFVDTFLVEELRDAELRLGTPRDEGTVLHFDRPWEGPFCGYATVVHDGERYLLYYRGLPRAGGDGTDNERTCVAISTDGITFSRPELSLFEVEGAAHNNVVLANAAPVSHNFSPFLDTRPGASPTRRFKALGGNEHSGLMAYVSADGLRWSRALAEPVFTKGMFDSQNVAFWSAHEERYLCYFRTWSGKGYSGFRTVSRTTSPDFCNWSEPEQMDFGDAPTEHLYTNQTHAYFRAPHLYVGIAARFLPGRQVLSTAEARELGVNPRYFKDCSDAVLLTSRGGTRYHRTFPEAFLRPGIGLQNWVSRSNYPACNVVQTGPTEMSFYVNQNYAQPSAEMRRYSLRLDGFASLHADRDGGQLLTRPLTFGGDTLRLNFSTAAAGEVRVGLTAADGSALPGYAIDDCVPLIGNELSRAIRWRRGDAATTDVGELAGKVVRLRFALIDADVYSFQFGDS